MTRQRFARFVPMTIDDVERAFWQPRLKAQLCKPESAQRREFCGLQHHGAAGSQRRSDLPRAQRKRVVPRRNGTNYTNRLTSGIGVVFTPIE